MAEDTAKPTSKRRKSVFVGDDQFSTQFVNVVDIGIDLETFFLTFGTGLPMVITPDQNLEELDDPDVHPLFRCAIPRSTMEQVIGSLTRLYEFQTGQIDCARALREREIREKASYYSMLIQWSDEYESYVVTSPEFLSRCLESLS